MADTPPESGQTGVKDTQIRLRLGLLHRLTDQSDIQLSALLGQFRFDFSQFFRACQQFFFEMRPLVGILLLQGANSGWIGALRGCVAETLFQRLTPTE